MHTTGRNPDSIQQDGEKDESLVLSFLDHNYLPPNEQPSATGSVFHLMLGLRSISVIIESNRSVISFRSVNLIEFTNISVSVNYRSVSVNSVSVSVFRFTEPIY